MAPTADGVRPRVEQRPVQTALLPGSTVPIADEIGERFIDLPRNGNDREFTAQTAITIRSVWLLWPGDPSSNSRLKKPSTNSTSTILAPYSSTVRTTSGKSLRAFDRAFASS